MLIEIAGAEVVAEVNTFIVQQFLWLLEVFPGLSLILRLIVLRLVTLKAKQSVCIDITLNRCSCMRDVQMGL